MPTLTLTALSAAFTYVLQPMMVGQTNRASVLLCLLDVETGAGGACVWDVKGGANDSGTFADGADIDASAATSDSKVQALLPWAIKGGAVSVGDLAASVAESLPVGHAPEELRGEFGLLISEIHDRCDKNAEHINQALYAGTGTDSGKPDIVGLDVVAAPTGVYAGIDPTTHTWWKGLQSTDASARDITKALVQEFFGQFIAKGANQGPGRKPDYFVLPPDLWLALKQDVELEKGVEVQVVQQVPGARGMVTLPAGSDAFTLDGTWCIRDPDCTAGTGYAWCRGAVKIKTLPSAQDVQGATQFDAFVKDLAGNVPVDFGTYGVPTLGAGRLRPYLKFLGKTGLATNAFVGVNMQLCVTRRNAVGALRMLQVPSA